MKNAWMPYCIPFGLFCIITYAGPLFAISPGILYPVKTVITAGALLAFRKAYSGEIRVCMDLPAVVAGIMVFWLWIYLDPFYPKTTPEGFNPFEVSSGAAAYGLIGFRLAGAVLVVPVMEELFWRSFAMRFLMGTRFKEIPLGGFTWFSFSVVAVAFGLEHHHWLPGIAAGLLYGLVLVRSKNLFSPILAHGTTNLILGIHVLLTHTWVFW
ncbi:MAG: CAAX prenyl protease-related protein [Pseudomonadota bacterium]